MKIAVICSDVADDGQLSLVGSLSKEACFSTIEPWFLAVPSQELGGRITAILNAWVQSGVFDSSVLVGGDDQNHSCFVFDNQACFESLFDHLYSDHGYRRFLFLLGPQSSFEAQAREAGLQKAILSRTEIQAEFMAGDFQEVTAYNLVKERFQITRDALPQVVVALNDQMALGTLRALADAKILVPQQCAVTGFGDVELAESSAPTLTTLRQSPDQMMQAIMGSLQQVKISQKSYCNVVATDLVIRESCGCHKPNASSQHEKVHEETFEAKTLKSKPLSALLRFVEKIKIASTEDHLVAGTEEFCLLAGLTLMDIGLFEVGDGLNYSKLDRVFCYRLGGIGRNHELVTVDRFLASSLDSPSPDLQQLVFFLVVEDQILGLLLCRCEISLAWMIEIVASSYAQALYRVSFATKIGLELHDDIGQRLAALSIYANILRNDFKLLDSSQELNKMVGLIDGLQARVKDLSRGLFLKDLEMLPFAEVVSRLLRDIEKQTQVKCHLEFNILSVEQLLSPEHQTHLLRIVQEALQNSISHGHVHNIEVVFERQQDNIHLLYKDDGIGFLVPGADGTRLPTIRHRVAQLLGTYRSGNLTDTPGMFIEIQIPLSGSYHQ